MKIFIKTLCFNNSQKEFEKREGSKSKKKVWKESTFWTKTFKFVWIPLEISINFQWVLLSQEPLRDISMKLTILLTIPSSWISIRGVTTAIRSITKSKSLQNFQKVTTIVLLSNAHSATRISNTQSKSLSAKKKASLEK